MSGHYDSTTNIPLPEMMNQGFPMYDNHYDPYSRITGPPSHYDGSGFWYRPDAEAIYESDPALYNRGVAMTGANMEATGIKHRRTRSGCYTCRSRRVKCDETRPICERCKKGQRDCEFPQATSSSKRTKHGESRSPTETLKHEAKESKSPTLETIKDESEPEGKPAKSSRRPTLSDVRTHSSQAVKGRKKHRSSQDASPLSKGITSPESSTSSGSLSRDETPASSFHASARSAEVQARHAKIKTLKPDMQKYLQFQHDYMTHYHYFFKLDPTDFVHNEFIDLALSFDPLLYATIGFAAYHYELRQPNANLSHFLTYHSRALVLLRKSLSKGEVTYTPAMLLTVLQLATVEEYLGDWVNLIGHHKAGFTMLTSIYTPTGMMQTDLGRRIFSWYARLDVIAGLMSGGTTRLDRPWYEANAAWYEAAVDDDPDNDIDIDGILAKVVSNNRLLGFDMATLFAKVSRSEISISQFELENARLIDRIQDMRTLLESLNDGFYTVTDFPAAETNPYNPDVDIVDPYIPGGLFKENLWNLNFQWIDWYAIAQMQQYQSSLLLNQAQQKRHSSSQSPTPTPTASSSSPHSPNPHTTLLSEYSLHQCRIYESIERYPLAPSGSLLGAHASLGLAIVFLQKDTKHTLWARKKLAGIERLGYVFPPSFRTQMAQLWGLSTDQVGEDEGVEKWWLPYGQGKPKILEDIRRVVAERHESSGGAGGAGDEGILNGELQDVRDLKAIFAKLDLRTSGGGGGASSMGSSGFMGGAGGGGIAADGMSPLSESAKSTKSAGSTTTGVNNSPSSVTTTGLSAEGMGDMGGVPERWSSIESATQQSQQTGAKGKGKERRREGGAGERERDADRMSGIWST